MGSRRSLFRVSRRGGRSAVKGGAGCGTLTVGLIAVGFVLWLVATVVRAVVAAFSTPYPWIAIALGGLGFASYKLVARVTRERRQAHFWVAVAAVGDRTAEADGALDLLGDARPGEADILLLAAARAADAQRDGEALEALARAQLAAAAVGSLSGGLCLRFPGLIVPLLFASGPANAGTFAIVRGHLLVRLGRPAEVLAHLAPTMDDALRIAKLSVLGDAHMAVGDFARALRAYQDSAAYLGHTAEGAEMRYRVARALEAAGRANEAAGAYDALGDFADAPSRTQAARRAHATTQAQEDARAREDAAARAQAKREAAARAEEDALQRAIEKLRAARGPAGRRAAIEGGLSAIETPGVRERLLVEASRVEVLVVLEKVDGLKTPAAKRRHLENALHALRSDDVRDELQAQQIAWLESALAEVDA